VVKKILIFWWIAPFSLNFRSGKIILFEQLGIDNFFKKITQPIFSVVVGISNYEKNSLTKFKVNEWMAAFDFQTKSYVIWKPTVLKSRFLLNIIRETSACNSGMVFFNLQRPSIIWPRSPPWGSCYYGGQKIAK